MTIELRPARVTAVLLALAFAVVAAGIGVYVARYGFERDTLMGLSSRFDLDREGGAPAWFSSALLLLAAATALARGALAGGAGEPLAGRWIALGALLAAMSLDETAQLHELVNDLVKRPPAGLPPPGFTWVVPGALVAAGIAAYFLPLVRSLDAPTGRRITGAAALYFGGAIGCEVAGNHLAAAGYRWTGAFAAEVVVEESAEMAGVILLIRAVLLHIEARFGTVAIRLGPATAPPVSRPSSTPGGGSPP